MVSQSDRRRTRHSGARYRVIAPADCATSENRSSGDNAEKLRKINNLYSCIDIALDGQQEL
jgi:hypothetical protein